MVRLGPLTLAWHGIMIAAGLAAGGWLASRRARQLELDPGEVLSLISVLAVAGIAGSRLLHLAQNDAGALLRPQDWLGTRGFSFNGAIVTGAAAAAVYLWRAGLSARHLDALAAGFPLGMAVGRIGDVINGEHHGPATTVPWGFRYSHPDADVPSQMVAYHSGGFYEVLLALAMLALLWPLRDRFRRATMLLWATIALYGAGRFVMFFYREDTDPAALGLNVAQFESLALVLAAGIAAILVGRARRARGRNHPADPAPLS